MDKTPGGYFSFLGNRFRQTGQVFSVGLINRVVLHLEHMTLLSFILLSAAILFYEFPMSGVWTATRTQDCCFGRKVEPNSTADPDTS